MEPSMNDSAMAVTGGPKSLPTEVVLPSRCERVAVALNAAMFPHVSCGEISGRVKRGIVAYREDTGEMAFGSLQL